MLRIALITTREGPLAAFRAGLEQHGFLVDCHADGWSFLQAARTRTCNLVVLDDQRTPFRPLLEQLLEVDASLNCAVLTDLGAETFHEATEGQGILCALPLRPGAGEVPELLAKLRAVGGLDLEVATAQTRLDAARRQHHPRCVVCSDRHPFGLQVDFRATGANAVEGLFACGKSYEGYENILHGGIVSSLLDGAMASCILAKGLLAYTVELRIRYRAPVTTGVPACIRGQWLRASGPLHLLQASLEQDGILCASARAKFYEGSPDQPSQPMPGGAHVRHLLSQARKRF